MRYHIGIGDSVLQLEERAKDLWEAISHIPLDRILVETDAPFILPYCKDVIQPKLLRSARNTSLILPAVIKKDFGAEGRSRSGSGASNYGKHNPTVQSANQAN